MPTILNESPESVDIVYWTGSAATTVTLNAVSDFNNNFEPYTKELIDANTLQTGGKLALEIKFMDSDKVSSLCQKYRSIVVWKVTSINTF